MKKLLAHGCLGAALSLTLACDIDPLAGTVDDAGTADVFRDAGPDAGPVVQVCDALSAPGDPDKTRVVLIGHSTQGIGGVETVHFLRTATLDVTGDFTLTDTTLDLPFSPVRIELVPSGSLALVVGEEGQVASVRVNGADDLALVGEVTVPEAGMNELRLSSDGRRAFVVGSNVTEDTSGISVIGVGCDGSLDVVEEAFFGLRLAESIAFLPGEQRAVLLGGQAVFDPVDDNDVRLLGVSADGFTQLGAFDLFGDFIDALRIAVSPDGTKLLIPNGSPFSAESQLVLVADIDGDVITESHRVPDLEDAREALFSPDGQTGLVTLFSANRVMVLADEGSGLKVVDEITGIGLAEQMALISRGALSGTVLVTSVDTSGTSNIARLRVTGAGLVEDEGQLDLPEGLESLPRAVAVQP